MLSSQFFQKKAAMKKKSQVNKLDRLLSGGLDSLSVQEKENILDEVSKQQEAPQPTQQDKPFVHKWVWVPALMLATAVAAFILVPFDFSFWNQSDSRDEFMSRGAGRKDASIELRCIKKNKEMAKPESSAPCGHGDILTFDIQMTPPCRYFSAAALGPDGVLIWYFPSDKETSQLAKEKGIIQRGIVIGDEHGPGAYQLFALFSSAPLSQEDAKISIENHIAAKPTKPKVLVEHFSVITP